MLKQLVQALQNNEPLEEILRERLSLRDKVISLQNKDLSLLQKENTILSTRLKLSLDVITDSSNENLKQVPLRQNSKLQKSTALTKKSHPNDVNILNSEDYLTSGFVLHTLVDGNLKFSVYEFTKPEFAASKYKMKKNDLKFLGNNTIMFQFPTSIFSKEMKIQMKAVLKGQETVNWNTAFVDISQKLISVIKAYRDNNGKMIYKDIGNKLLILIGSKYVDSNKTKTTSVSSPGKNILVEAIQYPNDVSTNVMDGTGIGVFNELGVVKNPPLATLAVADMAKLLTEMKSAKLKHTSPGKITGRKRKTSLELHLATSLEKKRLKIDSENDEESNDEWK
jgi:hypothetical protein